MSLHPFTPLPLAESEGSILLTPCPGTKEVELKLSLEQLKQAGAQAVLTLMSTAELKHNGVLAMPTLCENIGLTWLHFPIEDDCAPDGEFAKAWEKYSASIHTLLDSGKNIAIHCKGGSGRTGLMAAQILLERGKTLEEVTNVIKSLRPNALKLPVHIDYLLSLETSLKS